jgi:hypothetical protein
LRVGSNDKRGLTAVLCMGDDCLADLLRGAIVDQRVAHADSNDIRPAERGVRGNRRRKPLRVDTHGSTLRNPIEAQYSGRFVSTHCLRNAASLSGIENVSESVATPGLCFQLMIGSSVDASTPRQRGDG